MKDNIMKCRWGVTALTLKDNRWRCMQFWSLDPPTRTQRSEGQFPDNSGTGAKFESTCQTESKHGRLAPTHLQKWTYQLVFSLSYEH